jgi:hypothetical protein
MGRQNNVCPQRSDLICRNSISEEKIDIIHVQEVYCLNVPSLVYVAAELLPEQEEADLDTGELHRD